MPEITFIDDCCLNGRERTEVTKLVQEAAGRIAPSLLRVEIGTVSANIDGGVRFATCGPYQAGRGAEIEVSQAWRDSTPERRRAIIYHEILHVTLYPLYAAYSILAHQTDEAVARTSEPHFREALEGAVEDLTEALL